MIYYQRTALGRRSRTNQGERRVLIKSFQETLKEDRRSSLTRTVEEIKKLVIEQSREIDV